MKLIYLAFIILLVVMSSAQCQQNAEDWFNKGVDLYAQGKYDEAIKAYDKAVKLDPNYADAWNNKGKALCMQGKYNEAIKCYDEVFKQDPRNAVALNNKVNALNSLGRPSEANATISKAKKLSETIEDWINKGIELYAHGKYDEAIKAYNEAIELDPWFAVAWYNKGNALCGLSKYDDAIKAYNVAIKLDPNDAMALNNKGAALRNQSKYDDSKSAALSSNAQTDQEKSIVSPTTKVNPHSNNVKVPKKHTYKVGTSGINEFILNWTDNKVYSSKIRADIFDERDDNADVYSTKYDVQILNESETNVSLFFVITWHPSVKRPSAFTLENYPYDLVTDEVLSRSDVTIQGKKALMLTYKDKKEYRGSESKPLITSANYLFRYFLDDYIEIEIEGDIQDWQAQEFKSMLNSMKITPPDGYY